MPIVGPTPDLGGRFRGAFHGTLVRSLSFGGPPL